MRVAADGPDLQPWFLLVERTLSRFRPDSALSALNRQQGRWAVVPRLLYEAVEQALWSAEQTDGAFDPTVLPAVEACGYGQTFEAGPTPVLAPVPAGRWREVRLSRELLAVWLPPEIRLDLGGIGKGLAVDGAMRRLKGSPSALVDAGGDLAVRTPPGAGPVTIEVESPFNPTETIASFGLDKGAVATSSTMGRRWGAGLHHIINPVSGRPANSGVVSATVVAGSATRADVLAKACVVLGVTEGLRLLERHRCEGLLVTESGQVTVTRGLEVYIS